MRAFLQRSLSSKVTVDGVTTGSISHGLVVLVGFTHQDGIHEIEEMVDKIIHLRIFDDENGVMNRSLLDVQGSVLSVSQFTLYADTKKGRRPSYKDALHSSEASKLYQLFNEKLREQGVSVETGVFQANMLVSIENQGPVSILLESR